MSTTLVTAPRVSAVLGLAAGLVVWSGSAARPPGGTPDLVADPAAYVDPLIGTSNRGNTIPGATAPFGMVQWSPENTRGDATRAAAPGGYQYDATRIRGFSLTHLSGTGCRGASGDVPFMPYAGTPDSSPSADTTDSIYATRFSHANETAAAGSYQVRLASAVNVELTATARTGAARFTFLPDRPATLLIRASDSEVGSEDAEVTVDAGTRTVTGWVRSGNFCGYLDEVNRRSYYTLYFVAVFDRPFTGVGAWENDALHPGATAARGGTTYGTEGYPVAGLGSGAWVSFDAAESPVVGIRVGISYVSVANAAANLDAENPAGTSFDALRRSARDAWNERLRRIRIGGGTPSQRTTFYTALYHALLHPSLASDGNGEYRGFDQKVHTVAGGLLQRAQYANFSGWDVYRSQLQLVALLDPEVASDVAQSLLNQANQLGGVWDRWTHNSGATHVMTGDPSAPAVAGIVAFGGRDFDVEGAFASLARAARVPTPLDLNDEGCPVSCAGQRPSLDKWLALHYIPAVSSSWGGAGETLEDASADFALAQLAARLGDKEAHREFLERAQYWKNVFNPAATPAGGYIQNRNEDGTWPESEPASGEGFAEGSSAQYTWMVPFNVRGLFDAMGGDERVNERLDAFFRHPDGGWALTGFGPLHAEMDNEPSVGTPWLYLFSGRPDRAQETVRQVLDTLWDDRPDGIPGNDDLGAMSSWYVWAAMGMYPYYPGRAELLLTAPLFPQTEIGRPNGATITVRAPAAGPGVAYIRGLTVDGASSGRPWLPESFVAEGGALDFDLAAEPSPRWGRRPEDVPPSFSAEPP